MKHSRISSFFPFAVAAALFVALEFLSNNPQMYYWMLGGSFFINALAARILVGKEQIKEWYNFALLPILLCVIVEGFLIIVDSPAVYHLLSGSLAVAVYLYWRFVFFYFYAQSQYTAFSLENLAYYTNFFAVFLLGAGALALRMFLSLSFWQVSVVVAILLLGIIYQGFWVAKFKWRDYWPYLLTSWVVLTELFLVLMMLPHDYRVVGFIWALCYYAIIGLIGDWLSKQFNSFKAKAYIIIVVVSCVLLLATAVWI